VEEGDLVFISHPSPLNSMGHIRAKIYGKLLDAHACNEIMSDLVAGIFLTFKSLLFKRLCGSWFGARRSCIVD